MIKKLNISKIPSPLVILLAVLYLGTLPYFNLVLKVKLTMAIFLAVLLFISSITGKLLLKIAVLLLVVALILTLGHQDHLAEVLGEAIYSLLILGMIKELVQFFKEAADGRD